MDAGIIAKIAAAVRDRALEREMDLFIRAAILERIAGLPVGEWSGRPRAGLVAAAARFPEIHPLWVSQEDTGIYAAMRARARDEFGSVEMGEELVNEIMALAASPTGYNPFKNLAEQPQIAGRLDSHQSLGRAKALLIRFTQNRSKSVTRTEWSKRERDPANVRLGPTPPDEDRQRVHEVPVNPRDLDVLQQILTGPDRERLYEALFEVWRSDPKVQPNYIGVIEEWLKDPTRNPAQLARDLGVSATHVNKALKALIASGARAVEEGRLRAWPGRSIRTKRGGIGSVDGFLMILKHGIRA